ncbi:MAG: cell envelope integrity protein TolA [Bdellovibrionales bacterium]
MTRLQKPTVNDDSLRRSLGISAGLHIGVLLFLYFGLPVFLKPLPKPYVPIPIDIVDIAEITNTRVKEKPEDTPKPPEPPPVPEQKAAPPPPQQQAEPTPPKPPEPPQPQKAEQLEAITPAPKPAAKPKPPEKAKPQQDMLASVLKNVEKMKTAPQAKPQDTKPQVKEQTQAQPKSLAPALSDRLTMTEEDALRRQVEQCWNPPIGARDAKNLIVEVLIHVNPDRTVQSAEVVDKLRANSDPYFRAASEAAIRALYNPRCNPLLLPEGKYEQWKTINFNFDPRDML